MEEISTWLFWFSFFTLAYAYLGYHACTFLLSRCFPKPHRKLSVASPPTVTVVLVVYNEAQRILPRLENLLASEYPPDLLNVLVVSDGSTDGTDEKILSLGHPSVQLVRAPQRQGKPACLNLAVPQARGELVVFADARQRFAPNTIAELVANFSDPKVGAASGTLEIESAASNVGGGVDIYWRLEKALRHSESLCDSSIGCTGAVYAIRRSLFRALPADTLLDDVVIPMQITLQGFRVIFDPAAVACDPQSLEPAAEQVRKRRTLAGNFQMLFRYGRWLLPWENRLWWRLIAHKYLRLAGPVLVVLLLATNALLRHQPLYRELSWGQGAFYLLAFIGGLLPGCKLRLLSLPAGFLFLNLMVVQGLWRYLTRPVRAGWETLKRH